MRIAAFSNFEGPDFAALAVSAGIGYFIGTLMPAGAPAIYTVVLVSYHLFLGWLIFVRNPNQDAGEKKAGISLPLGHTILTHAACLVIILAPVAAVIHAMPTLFAPHVDPDDANAALTAMQDERHILRVIQGVCSSIAALAFFERRWLFTSESSEAPQPHPAPEPPSTLRSTAEDAAEWQRYIAANQRSFPPGTSLKAEYQKWLAARTVPSIGQDPRSAPPRL